MVTMVAAPVVDMVKNVSRISQACLLLRARTEVCTTSCPYPLPSLPDTSSTVPRYRVSSQNLTYFHL